MGKIFFRNSHGLAVGYGRRGVFFPHESFVNAITGGSPFGNIPSINPDWSVISSYLWGWYESSGISPDGANPDTSGVSGWLDNSPNSNHYAQNTDATQPHVASGDGPDGSNSMWFDGATYLQRTGESNWGGNSLSYTMFAVVRPSKPAVAHWNTVWSAARNNSSTTERYGMFSTAVSNHLSHSWFDTTTVHMRFPIINVGQWEIWCWQRKYEAAGTDVGYVWQSGILRNVTASGFGDAESPNANQSAIGCLFDQTPSDQWEGNIQELILYGGNAIASGYLSDNVVSGIHVYLANKYGLSLGPNYS